MAIFLQAFIGGMSANATDSGQCIMGAMDPASGVLMLDMHRVVAAGDKEAREPGCAVLTNNANSDDYDALFAQEDIRDAIDDYFAFSGRGLLHLEPEVSRFDPASKIEPDGIDERGRKFRIAADIGNGQVAVMALCWMARRQQSAAALSEDMDDLQSITIMSMGMPGMTSKGVQIGGRFMGGMGNLMVGPDGWPV